MRLVRRFIPAPGSVVWQLAISYWLLAIGYWLLAIGYWLLAIGYWLLASYYNFVIRIFNAECETEIVPALVRRNYRRHQKRSVNTK
ncbi:hypothetical protein FNU76_13060 [Chitinimonas arctica]|uniref:Uncharacterized protein n=1 Tax=Chitinimonas arctica TaxID=2594795 RepID=A0A516SGD0_9NEIS|nr:hypothetical protein FNU76_13060 [Chitinimonas arctica]